MNTNVKPIKNKSKGYFTFFSGEIQQALLFGL